MRVKILSMQRVLNYGSFMQAYAMKRIVESYGHEVEFCDFRKGQPRHRGEKAPGEHLLDKAKKIPGIIAAPARYAEKRRFRRRLRECFEQQAWPLLGFGSRPNFDTCCDLMLIGSDEVFNYTQNQTFGYVPTLFGHGIEAHRIIAYAASAGYATPNDVENDDMQMELSEGFAKFWRIGVRDRNTYELVARYAPEQPTYVIDPTLVYDFADEIIEAAPRAPYLLVYAYEGRLDAPNEVRIIRAFAAQKGLRVVSIGSYHQWCDENLVAAPLELLALFKNAAYVVTDTFHGTIFSIKGRRPFVSLIRGENKWGSNQNKLSFLLEQLGLESRINRDLGQLGAHLDSTIDYERVFTTLASLQARSVEFLAESLAANLELPAAMNKTCQ